LDELVPGPEKYMGEKTTTGVDVVQMWHRFLSSGNLDDFKNSL
jgi:hypothetical protein